MSTTAFLAALTLVFGCALDDFEDTEAETETRTVVVETEVEIFEGITFDGDTAAIAASSARTLDAVARTLAGNPSITRLQVRGHTDARTERAARAELSRARAEAVVARLVGLGGSPDRLEAYGASDAEPVAASPEDPANARIELVILERDAD
ncbi:MAG: OmpA family protein [Deltaproteobacteria bacterium]|nr:OmpA family protein [Deltaproteobacteria bacterium]